MTNIHGNGRRLICNDCNAASPTFDKSATWAFVRSQLQQQGWRQHGGAKSGRDRCPACAKKHLEAVSGGEPDGR